MLLGILVQQYRARCCICHLSRARRSRHTRALSERGLTVLYRCRRLAVFRAGLGRSIRDAQRVHAVVAYLVTGTAVVPVDLELSHNLLSVELFEGQKLADLLHQNCSTPDPRIFDFRQKNRY